MKKKIIFICNGNIHRSVIAAQCFRNILKKHNISQSFMIDSFGLQGTQGTVLPKQKHLSDYPKEWKAAKPILKKFDIDISQHSFKKITPDIAKKASVIVAMDKKVYSGNKNSLLKQFPKQKKKIHLISKLTLDGKGIKDPVGSGSRELHRKVIEKIYSTLTSKYKTILSWAKEY